jgi:hypothetical protein
MYISLSAGSTRSFCNTDCSLEASNIVLLFQWWQVGICFMIILGMTANIFCNSCCTEFYIMNTFSLRFCKLRGLSCCFIYTTLSFQASVVTMLFSLNRIRNQLMLLINQSTSTHVTFTVRNQTCPRVQMGNVDLSHKKQVKYLG